MYLVLDFETTSKESHGRGPCNQFDPANRIVATAYKLEGQDSVCVLDDGSLLYSILENHNITTIIGHNIKFDLLFVWGNPKLREWLRNGGKIWDTMLAAFLLGGQEARFTTSRGFKTTYASLDELSEVYGGTQKNADVKEYFGEGDGGAENVPVDILLKYGAEDVSNTEIVALGQLAEARDLGMVDILKVHMDHLASIIEMEFNGVVVDRDRLEAYKHEFRQKLVDIEVKLAEEIKRGNHWSLPVEFSPASNAHVSGLLFQGKVGYIEDVVKLNEDGSVMVFKGGKTPGKPKTKREKVYRNNVNNFNLPPLLLDETATPGVYKVDDKILSRIAIAHRKSGIAPIVELLQEYRTIGRLLKTYIVGGNTKKEKGLRPCIHSDGRVHPNIESCTTKTGRSACETPNLQNIPGEIRDMFVSRYEGGQIVTADFSQIEIIMQAFLCQSDKMIDEIRTGVDFHCKRLAWAEGMDYDTVVKLVASDPVWKEKRSAIKAVSFAKQYGAGPKKVSFDTGIPIEVVQKIYDDEEREYPETKVFYDSVFETIKRTTETRPGPLRVADFKNKRTIVEESEQNHVGFYQSIFGKRYSFHEWAMIGRGGELFRYYKPTEVANYMVQGSAGDVLFLMLGKLFRIFLDKYRHCGILILEVHDEVVLDIRPEYIDEIKKFVKEFMESAPTEIEKTFGFKFNVPISASVGSGANWREAK